MSSGADAVESLAGTDEWTLLRQRDQPEQFSISDIGTGSLDRWAIFFTVVVPVLVAIFLLELFLTLPSWMLDFRPEQWLAPVVAYYSAVFTFLSVRESKLTREATVAPALFLGVKNQEFGLVNLGSGPAHEVEARLSGIDALENGNIPLKDEIIQTRKFCPLDCQELMSPTEDDEYVSVTVEYRSNLGREYSNITRQVKVAEIRPALNRET
jgi:hypothetical protein